MSAQSDAMATRLAAVLPVLWPHAQPGLVAGIVKSAPAIFDKYGIGTKLRVIHPFAQFGEETGDGGAEMVESLNYSHVSRLRAVWPSRFRALTDSQIEARYIHNEKALANFVYDGRMGNVTGSDDGFTYRGRGLLQTTGRDGFAELAKLAGLDVVAHPEYLTDPDHALDCGLGDFCLIAKALPYADEDNLLAVSALVNVGHLKGVTQSQVENYTERQVQLSRWRKVF